MGLGQREGFVVWHRSVFASELWQLPGDDFKLAFALVGYANWSEERWFDGTRHILIPRGVLVTSQKKLAADLGISRHQLRRSLNKLARIGFVNPRTNQRTRYASISVINYDRYQDVSEQPAHEMRTRRARDAHETRTSEQVEQDQQTTHVANGVATGKQGHLFEPTKREPPINGTSPRSIAQRVVGYVNKKRNGTQPSRLGFEAYVKLVTKALAANVNEKELKLVVWWAAEHEWPLAHPDHARRVHPSTLFPLTKHSGYRALPQYLDLARERYREVFGKDFDRTMNPETLNDQASKT